MHQHTENPDYTFIASRDDCYHVVAFLHHFLKYLQPSVFPEDVYANFVALDLITGVFVFVFDVIDVIDVTDLIDMIDEISVL